MLKELFGVLEQIEDLYLMLFDLELKHQKYSGKFRTIIKKLEVLINEEKTLLWQNFANYEEIKKDAQLKKLSEAGVLRLNNLFLSMSGDAGIEYADTLNYDIHRIMLKIIEFIIDNPYYEEVRRDLLTFKYNIIFEDYNIESDFILRNDMTSIALISESLKEDVPSFRYINKAVLVSEIKIVVEELKMIYNDSDIESYVIIKMINILARMALCSDNELEFVIKDVQDLLWSEEVSYKVRNICLEMVEVFKQIQNSFYFSR